MPFDIYYHTLSSGRTYVKTVGDEDTASAMCIKNNRKMTPTQVKLNDGHMYFIENPCKTRTEMHHIGKLKNESYNKMPRMRKGA